LWTSLLAVNKLFDGWIRKMVCILILLAGIFALMSLVQRYVVLHKSLSEGTRPNVLADEIRLIPQSKKIGMSSSLMLACFYPYEWSRCDFKTQCDFLVLPQAASSRKDPPVKNGWRLFSNHFRDSSIAVGPVQIANTDRSYNYAIYERLKSD
jgi:hypothetical protein